VVVSIYGLRRELVQRSGWDVIMSFNENFDSGLGSYAITYDGVDPPTNGGWVSTQGNPSGGSVQLFYNNNYPTDKDGVLDNGSTENPTGDTHLVLTGEKLYFNYKVVDWDAVSDTRWIYGEIHFLGFGSEVLQPAPEAGEWHQFEFDLASRVGQTVSKIVINLAPLDNPHDPYHVFIDTILIDTDPPPFTADTPVSTFDYTHSVGGIPGSIAI
jgi:hypothetical protein